MDTLRERLVAALPRAIKERDRHAVAALRTTLAAVDDAEAVPAVPVEAAALDGPVARSRAGVGVAEAERRTLSELEVRGIVLAAVSERVDAARTYERVGMPEHATRARAEAAALRAHLD